MSSQVEPPELDAEELCAAGTVSFGTRRSYWVPLLLAAGVLGFVGLYFWALPHFHPPARAHVKETKMATLVTFLGALFFAARGAWLARARLWITPQWLAQRRFGVKAIHHVDVNQIVWRVDGLGEVIEIHGAARFIRIRLETFDWKDQISLVALIRRTFPSDIQSGWNGVFERRLSNLGQRGARGDAPRAPS